MALSRQVPHPEATPREACRSQRFRAPLWAALRICFSVIALQIHTYMAGTGFVRVTAIEAQMRMIVNAIPSRFRRSARAARRVGQAADLRATLRRVVARRTGARGAE
mgnify:CR=1 FL=1